MALIENIPFFLSLFCALFAVMVSMLQLVTFQVLCLRTSIVILIFYILGIAARKVLKDIMKENEDKRRQEETMQDTDSMNNMEHHSEDLQTEILLNEEAFQPLNLKKLKDTDAKIIADVIRGE